MGLGEQPPAPAPVEGLTEPELVEKLKAKSFKNVVVLSGAGLSVGAGIPDFRTPGTGMYSRMQKYNLPTPEAIFQLEYFRKNPEPFYEVASEFFQKEANPTKGHAFIEHLHSQGMLLCNLTQNIDSLEVAAGVPREKLIFAHGHTLSAHCIDCKKEAPIATVNDHIKRKDILKCDCGSLVKPDVVFFGEALPAEFTKAPELMAKADLVIVIGTSLKVYPFAFLVEMTSKGTPLVLINNEDSLESRAKLWLKGDIQENATRLLA